MMARQHVTFAVGVAGSGIATAAYVSETVGNWVNERPFEVLLSLLLIAGLALVPDLDHHGSTLTKKLGWLGWIIHHSMKAVGVKHRGFMHSFLFAAILGITFAVLTLIASIADYLAVFVGITLLFFATVTFNFIFGKTGRNPAFIFILAAGIAYGVYTGDVDLGSWWVPISAFVGPLLHDLGDMLTKSKFAFWAPFSKKKVGAVIGFKTNTPFETGFLRWVFFVWSLMMIAWVVGMSQGYFVRTDFSDADVTNPDWWATVLPYIFWQFA